MNALQTAVVPSSDPASHLTVIEGRSRRHRHRRGDGTVYEDKRNRRFVVKGPWDGGKKHYYRTRTEAENARRVRVANQNAAASTLIDQNITVRRYIEDRWLPTRDGLTAGTRKHDRTKWALFVKYHGSKRVRDLTKTLITTYLNVTLIELGKDNATERKHHHLVIHKILEAAVEAGVIVTNPARRIKVTGWNAKAAFKPKKLSTKQWADLRRAAQKFDRGQKRESAKANTPWLPYRATFDLQLYHHMRPGEIYGVTWDRIDLENWTIHIAQQLQPNGGTPSPKNRRFYAFKDSSLEIVSLKRETGERTLEIDDRTRPAILEMLRAQKKVHQRDPDWNPADLVFPDLDGVGFHDKEFHERVWEPVATCAGLPLRRKNGGNGYTWYSLKHNGMTARLSTGMSLNTLQRLSGHTSANTVWKYLLQVADEEFKREVRANSTKLP